MVFLPRMQYTGYLMGCKIAPKDNTFSIEGPADAVPNEDTQQILVSRYNL